MAHELPGEADQWIAEYQDRLDESEEYTAAGEGRGVGFSGDSLFQIQLNSSYGGEPVYLFVAVRYRSCEKGYVTKDPKGLCVSRGRGQLEESRQRQPGSGRGDDRGHVRPRR